MTREALITFLLAMLVGIAVPSFAATPSLDRSNSREEGASFQALFATETEPPERQEEGPRVVPLGPACLLLGILLLAASGRQYAKQHNFAGLEIREIRAGLESLVDESVHIDAGQHEALHEEMEKLHNARQKVMNELRQLQGGTSP